MPTDLRSTAATKPSLRRGNTLEKADPCSCTGMRGNCPPCTGSESTIATEFGNACRSSLAQAGALLAVNLYRHHELRPFADDEFDAACHVAPLLLACVERHLALQVNVSAPSLMQGLTPREREVCERLLKGWTHDGIAADLGVSAATVKTYRDRAFERLGIHHRNELFALMVGSLSARPA